MIKMSQETLADHLGLTFQQVQKYEKGTNRVSASRLAELSRALEVPIEFFFDGLSGAQKPLPKNRSDSQQKLMHDFLASSDGLALATAFMRLPSPKMRRHIVQLVKEFADQSGRKK
jgi:transcriptional regulator with XRE-family HTH domain